MARVCRPAGTLAARDADYAAMAWYPRLPGLDLWAAAVTRDDLEAIGEAFRAWGTAPGALFVIPHLELLGSPA